MPFGQGLVLVAFSTGPGGRLASAGQIAKNGALVCRPYLRQHFLPENQKPCYGVYQSEVKPIA
jgi:hypothetical protein